MAGLMQKRENSAAKRVRITSSLGVISSKVKIERGQSNHFVHKCGTLKTMISLQNITWEGTNGTILADQTINIAPSECVAFVGGPDTGKTTLIGLLTGERKPKSGSILIDGIPLEKLPPRLLQIYRRSLGFVLQKDQLLPDRSVAEQIALPLEVRGFQKGEIPSHVFEILQKASLVEKKAVLPDRLTLGERQRTALAQAIATDPKILLLDEPLPVEIDGESATVMLTMLQTALSHGASVIVVTRNAKILASLRPREVRLEKELSIAESPKTLWKKSEGTRIMPVAL